MGAFAGQSDLELLEAWRTGDRDSGNELARRYFEGVVRYFESHLRDARRGSEPRDLAQRTFEACIAGRDRIHSDFRGYLFGIARHELIREWKRRRDRGDVVSPSEAGLEHDGTSASRAVARVDDQRMLLELLEQIPSEYSAVLVRFFWEEHPISEIARDLGIAPGTVKSRLHRGKSLLKERLVQATLPDQVRESTARRLDTRDVDDG